ncbi:MAG: 5-demethoxyubiquinol-8 5-hydroxylase UbiM [Rhodobacterales bacterium]|nr:5-demethoxyubiquinol-8 5-hydroxylase UbiM [Rhodobacterales bacterium]
MTQTHFDVIIIGAGPAGLGLARTLADTPLNIAIIDGLDGETLANPSEDGRDIALTHTSEQIMQDLGMWAHIPDDQCGLIRDAKVINGKSDYALHFDASGKGSDYLGRIVPNYLIRRAAYTVVKDQENLTMMPETRVTGVKTDAQSGQVTLDDGTILTAALIVAADSRFSASRRMMGLSANSLDFGRVVIVCEMAHDLPHNNTATECFHYDQTLAILPMNGLKSSVVVTLPTDAADRAMAMPEQEFSDDIAARFGGSLGAMRLTTKRHPYPLVAVLARQFVTTRFALVGDAAVGMHPVTAHGYNLGLSGAGLLANEVRAAAARGDDIGALHGLKRYEAAHKRAVLPLYHGTNALVRLYTDNTVPGRILRGAALRLGNVLAPVKNRILHQLTHIDERAR